MCNLLGKVSREWDSATPTLFRPAGCFYPACCTAQTMPAVSVLAAQYLLFRGQISIKKNVPTVGYGNMFFKSLGSEEKEFLPPGTMVPGVPEHALQVCKYDLLGLADL